MGSKVPIKIVANTDTAFGGLVKPGDFPAEDLVLWVEGQNYYPLPMTQADYDTATGGGAFLPSNLPNLAAWFRKGVGQTNAGGGACSQWADQSGNGRHLKQATGAAQPAIQGDGTILFDGTSDFLKCDAFTLNQPFTVYLRFKQVTHTANDRIFDGDTNLSTVLLQDAPSPTIELYAGSVVAANTKLVVDTYGSVASVFNGASSVLQVDNTTATTGNPGAANAGGFTLGAIGGGASGFSNIRVKEAVIYSVAHNQATRDQVIAYLNTL